MAKNGELTPTQRRLLDSAYEIERQDPASILYAHTVLAQTSLPYRDPGDDVRVWDRKQGRVSLRIRAGDVYGEDDTFRPVGLPWGTKPRLILAHLNAEALRTGSPVIEVEDSLCAFVERLGFSREGRTIRTVKDQLTRLAAAEIRLGVTLPEGRRQVQGHIVSGFELWQPKDARQRVLWPSTVCLSHEYFASLAKHAVPLDERALVALSQNAMALDIYAWLAQRLHRIEPTEPARLPWPVLQQQFGQSYGRLTNFRRVFRSTLAMVLSQYRGARVEVGNGWITLRHSPPPVKGRIGIVRRPALG